MLKTVSFLSLAAFLELSPSEAVAVISIRDYSSSRKLPSFEGYRHVLPVHMLDVAEEHLRLSPGTWADEPTASQHLEYCEEPDNYAPSLSHAQAIQNFLVELDAETTGFDVVVHCSQGVSRSAAVASWAAERFGIPLIDPAGQGLAEANPRLLRLLRGLP
ncbi:MAG: hypothetical protein WCG13_00020 [Burkholderiales bacterium]